MMARDERDMRIRKGQACGAFWKMKNIWQARNIPLELKIRIFKASCLAILLYGSETWALTTKMKSSLDSYATSCYRVMLNIKRIDHVTNEAIYQRVKQPPLSSLVVKRQLTWVGHILRRPKEELIRKYAMYEPGVQMGKSKRGKKELIYKKYIIDLLSHSTEFQL